MERTVREGSPPKEVEEVEVEGGDGGVQEQDGGGGNGHGNDNEPPGQNEDAPQEENAARIAGLLARQVEELNNELDRQRPYAEFGRNAMILIKYLRERKVTMTVDNNLMQEMGGGWTMGMPQPEPGPSGVEEMEEERPASPPPEEPEEVTFKELRELLEDEDPLMEHELPNGGKLYNLFGSFSEEESEDEEGEAGRDKRGGSPPPTCQEEVVPKPNQKNSTMPTVHIKTEPESEPEEMGSPNRMDMDIDVDPEIKIKTEPGLNIMSKKVKKKVIRKAPAPGDKFTLPVRIKQERLEGEEEEKEVVEMDWSKIWIPVGWKDTEVERWENDEVPPTHPVETALPVPFMDTENGVDGQEESKAIVLEEESSQDKPSSSEADQVKVVDSSDGDSADSKVEDGAEAISSKSKSAEVEVEAKKVSSKSSKEGPYAPYWVRGDGLVISKTRLPTPKQEKEKPEKENKSRKEQDSSRTDRTSSILSSPNSKKRKLSSSPSHKDKDKRVNSDRKRTSGSNSRATVAKSFKVNVEKSSKATVERSSKSTKERSSKATVERKTASSSSRDRDGDLDRRRKRTRSKTPPRKKLSKAPVEKSSKLPLPRSSKATVERKATLEKSSKATMKRSSESPVEKSSKAPVKRDSKTTVEKSSKAPVERDSNTVVEKSSKCPVKNGSKPALAKSSKATVEKSSKSPVKNGSKAPVESDSKSNVGRSSKDPVQRGSKTTAGKSSISPVKNSSKDPVERDSKTNKENCSKATVQRSSKANEKKSSKSTVERSSKSPVKTSSKSVVKNSSKAPAERSSKSTVERKIASSSSRDRDRDLDRRRKRTRSKTPPRKKLSPPRPPPPRSRDCSPKNPKLWYDIMITQYDYHSRRGKSTYSCSTKGFGYVGPSNSKSNAGKCSSSDVGEELTFERNSVSPPKEKGSADPAKVEEHKRIFPVSNGASHMFKQMQWEEKTKAKAKPDEKEKASEKKRKEPPPTLMPVPGPGIGLRLLKKMGWKPGEAIGKKKDPPLKLEPLPTKVLDSLTGKGKHPVSVLMELAAKQKWDVPEFRCRELRREGSRECQFLYSVKVNGVEYEPEVPLGTKKRAKGKAARYCLQKLGFPMRSIA